MVRRTAKRPGRPGSPARARVACALALVLALGACADPELRRISRSFHREPSASPVLRYQREADMNRQWQNKPLTELLASRGAPKLVVNIPGGGMPPSYAVVYEPDPDSGCIDAFAVSTDGDPVVRIYHCR